MDNPRVQTFVISLKPQSWNVLVRKHYWTVKKVFDEWREATIASLLRGRVRPCSAFPVHVHYHAQWKQNRRHDIDSLLVKAIQDTITEAKIWPDDSLKYVASVLFSGETGASEDSLVVTIEEKAIE